MTEVEEEGEEEDGGEITDRSCSRRRRRRKSETREGTDEMQMYRAMGARGWRHQRAGQGGGWRCAGV